MKKLLFGSLIVLVSLFIIAYRPAELPPIPEVCNELSEEISLEFKINKVSYNNVELVQIGVPNPQYFNFKVAGKWNNLKPALILTSVSDKSTLTGAKNRQQFHKENKGKNGFSMFMQDKKGKEVSTYRFKNTMIEDESGKRFIRMKFDGPDMPMVNRLVINNRVKIPGPISRNFATDKELGFSPGTYTLDNSINGFYISHDMKTPTKRKDKAATD